LKFYGDTLISGGEDHTVRVWSIDRGENELTMKHKGAVTCMDFCGGVAQVVSGSKDKSAALWDLNTGRILLYTLL
jgi:WD40 repeat protein